MHAIVTIGMLLLTALILSQPPAYAQEQRLRVSFGSATTAGAVDSKMALAGSVGYRFTDRFSFDVEVIGTQSPVDRFTDLPFTFGIAGASGLARFGDLMAGGRGRTGPSRPVGMPIDFGAFRMPEGFDAAMLSGLRGTTDGRTILATVGFRYELPIQGGRLKPYLNAGLGMARTDEEFTFRGLAGIPDLSRMWRTPGSAEISDSVSHTGLATSAGVGASLRVFKQLSVDIDARYFRLDRDRNLGLFGGGVSYRF
jgi:opacity protein-like surface antigen